MTRPIAAMLFDLDGTLLDSIEGILGSFRHALARHLPQKTFTRAELVLTIGEPLPVQMLAFADGDQAMATRLVDDYRAHNAAFLKGFPLYPGVHETLAGLRQRGFPVGIVTSKYRASADVSLNAHGLHPKFDLVITADDSTKHKPDPMPLFVAAERLGISPSEIAYLGDSVHDLNCANAAGAMAIAALWGPFVRGDLLKLAPAYALESLRELLAIPELAAPATAKV